jgi:hypothetical protein
MSTIEKVETLVTALQSGDLEMAASILSDDFTVSGLTPEALDKRVFLAVQSELLAAMPDFSYNLSDVRQEDDKVRAFISITGTHNRDLSLPMFGLQSVPATGLYVVLPQVQTEYLFEKDLVKNMYISEEPGSGLSGLLQQIGAELPVLPRERNFPQ